MFSGCCVSDIFSTLTLRTYRILNKFVHLLHTVLQETTSCGSSCGSWWKWPSTTGYAHQSRSWFHRHSKSRLPCRFLESTRSSLHLENFFTENWVSCFYSIYLVQNYFVIQLSILNLRHIGNTTFSRAHASDVDYWLTLMVNLRRFLSLKFELCFNGPNRIKFCGILTLNIEHDKIMCVWRTHCVKIPYLRSSLFVMQNPSIQACRSSVEMV